MVLNKQTNKQQWLSLGVLVILDSMLSSLLLGCFFLVLFFFISEFYYHYFLITNLILNKKINRVIFLVFPSKLIFECWNWKIQCFFFLFLFLFSSLEQWIQFLPNIKFVSFLFYSFKKKKERKKHNFWFLSFFSYPFFFSSRIINLFLVMKTINVQFVKKVKTQQYLLSSIPQFKLIKIMLMMKLVSILNNLYIKHSLCLLENYVVSLLTISLFFTKSGKMVHMKKHQNFMGIFFIKKKKKNSNFSIQMEKTSFRCPYIVWYDCNYFNESWSYLDLCFCTLPYFFFFFFFLSKTNFEMKNNI